MPVEYIAEYVENILLKIYLEYTVKNIAKMYKDISYEYTWNIAEYSF